MLPQASPHFGASGRPSGPASELQAPVHFHESKFLTRITLLYCKYLEVIGLELQSTNYRSQPPIPTNSRPDCDLASRNSRIREASHLLHAHVYILLYTFTAEWHPKTKAKAKPKTTAVANLKVAAEEKANSSPQPR